MSFGKLLLSFLLFYLLVIFSVAMQTSFKLINENSKKIEETLSSNLDFTISETTEQVYIHNIFNSIIEIAKKEGLESQKLNQAISDCYFNKHINAKFIFYKNNEYVKSYYCNLEEQDFFKDIIKTFDYDVLSPEFVKERRSRSKFLHRAFGPANQLDHIRDHKSLLNIYYLNGTNQYYYWNKYENGLTVFFYTYKIPDFITRFKDIKGKYNLNRIGAIDSTNKIIVPPEDFSDEQTLWSYLNSVRTSKSFYELKDYYWYFQTTKEFNKICYSIPINSKENYFYNWGNLIEKISLALIIIVLILFITSFLNVLPGKKLITFLDNLSIRYRITGIFLIASIFPMLIAFINAFTLLSDKEKVIEEAIHSECLAGIAKLENQYKEYENKNSLFHMDLREAVKNEEINDALFQKYLRKYDLESNLARLEVRDSNINQMISTGDKEINGIGEMMDIISRITIKQHTPERIKTDNINISPGELVSEDVLSTDELGFATLMRQRGKLWTFKVGAFGTFLFWDVYPELATGPAFICISTETVFPYKKHMDKYLQNTQISTGSYQLYAFINEAFFTTETSLQKDTKLPHKQLIDIANNAYINNKVIFRTVNISGQPYWVTAKQEKNVGCLVFLYLINKEERLKALNPFKWQLFLEGLFTLIISLSGALFITRLVILPINDLSDGIEAIRYRYKDFTIPVRRKDEFGELAIAFNRILGELKNVEQGKIVQENLLPHQAPVIDGYDIAFFTIAASDLAGDYHDYVELEDGRISIILGDVSGHGISASLAMAMAKATFIYAKNNKVKFPDEFMDMLNFMFNKELKKRNKLMTLISMVLNPKTNEVIFDNAGQAYPGYYSEATHSCEELKMPSLPIGGMKKRKKKPIVKKMEPGDAFIFYTDGIIEATSTNGEMFGYDRFYAKFTELMKSKFNAKDAINALYQSVDNFRESGHYSDDITLIIVKKL